MTKSSYWYYARHAKDRESRVICSWNNVGAVYIPLGFNINNYHATPLDNGLAPTRRQAIIWTNDSYITDAYMRHSASMS